MATRVLALVRIGSLLTASGAAAQVAYVGDSLDEGTTPRLRERLSASLDARRRERPLARAVAVGAEFG